MTFADQFLAEATRIIERLDTGAVEALAARLAALRARGGRLFVCGVGGGAAHASHAAADFRKIAQIEAYAVTDNVAELTARTNDDGWESSYVNYLRGSRLRALDAVFVFSVGGGDLTRNVSANVARAVEYAKQVGAEVYGVVGRDGGHTKAIGDAVIVVPVECEDRVTAHTESCQALVWHLLVSHPQLQRQAMKWESLKDQGPSLTVSVQSQ
jgi:D-sedoheptulose 7-phosphate isomerase